MPAFLSQLAAFQLTRRSYAALVLAAGILGLSHWWPWLGPLAAAWTIVLFALLLADWRMAPQPSQWMATRQHDNRLSLDDDNPVTITLNCRRGRGMDAPVHLWLRDTPPSDFLLPHGNPVLSGVCTPGASVTLGYSVHPPRRGDYRFGDLHLRWKTPLGLLYRQTTLAAAAHVRVYPNLRNLRRYDILARRNQTWELGLRSAKRFGSGAEFERLRDYQPDDEYRRIHWKATARRHTPMVMEYETERSQNIVVVLDIGRMMLSPVGAVAKLDYAINTVLMLAWVALHKGDRVGLLTFADTPQTWIPPAGGRNHFHHLLEQLYAVESIPTEPDYSAAFTWLATRQNKRSLVLVFSDLTGDLGAQTLFAHLALLQKRHLTQLVTLRDPTIQSWAHAPAADTTTLYRRTIAADLLEERRLLLERMERAGVAALDVPAADLNARVINRYLELKARALL